MGWARIGSLFGFGGWLRGTVGVVKLFTAVTTIVSFLVLLISFELFPSQLKAHELDQRDGYISSLDQEGEVPKDIIIPSPPESLSESSLQHDRIFPQQLSDEFTSRYEQKFGRTLAEQKYLLQANPFQYVPSQVGGFQGTQVQASGEQRVFGEYMVRRVAEYHVDFMLKNEPKLRTIQEVKEKIGHAEVQVTPGWTATLKYSFGGNFLDLSMLTPLASLLVRFDAQTLDANAAREATYSLSRPITSTISAESHYSNKDGIAKFVGRKSWTSRFESSILVSSPTKMREDLASTQENLFLGGISYVF